MERYYLSLVSAVVIFFGFSGDLYAEYMHRIDTKITVEASQDEAVIIDLFAPDPSQANPIYFSGESTDLETKLLRMRLMYGAGQAAHAVPRIMTLVR